MDEQADMLRIGIVGDHLEHYSVSSNVAALTKSHINEAFALQDALLKENWPTAAVLGIRCLGLGHGSFRFLLSERKAGAKRQAHMKAVGEALYQHLHSRAQDRHWPEFIGELRKKLEEIPSEHLREMEDDLRKLEKGQITKDLSFLHRFIRPEQDLSERKMVDDTAIMLLSKGLLGYIHAEFNRVFQGRSPNAESESLLLVDVHSAFDATVKEFGEALRAGQRAMFSMLLADQSTLNRIDAAYSLASFIEERLPRFTRAQACAMLATRVLRQQGKGTAAEKLGRLAVEAGTLTREAVASHAASYRMAMSLLYNELELEEDMAQLLKRIPGLSFDISIPNGRNTELAKLAKVKDGDYVEVEGFANSVDVGRSADGKLIAQLELVDPSSGVTASAVAIYTNLINLGVTEGVFCRVNGTYCRKSSLLGNKPAIEVERLSLAGLIKKCWRIAFLESSKRWFQCWPNGINMYWSLGPHRRARAGDEVTHYGAAELFHTPMLRRIKERS